MIESRSVEEKIVIVRTLFECDFRCLSTAIVELRKRNIKIAIGALRSYAERLRAQLKAHDPAAEWIVRKALEEKAPDRAMPQ